MDIRISKFQIKSGRLKGHWRLKLKYRNEAGELVVGQQKTYHTERAAIDARAQLEADFQKTNGQIVRGAKMTFADLAADAKRNLYKTGKSARSARIYLDTLTQFFGDKRIGQITRADLKLYSDWRKDLGSRHTTAKLKRPITQTTINRELAIMRHVMKEALAEGWVTRDIFAGSRVIKREQPRNRFLTYQEEDRLLACCYGEQAVSYQIRGKQQTTNIECGTPYLKAAVLLALDSGLRKAEILSLKWKDIDFVTNLVHIDAANTKSEQSRLVPLSQRTKIELLSLPSAETPGLVFTSGDFKRSWATALRLAGIDGLRFHDLRRTAVTRMNVQGIPLAIASKVAGHASVQTTTKHYVSTDVDIVQSVTAAIDAANDARRASLRSEQSAVSDMIN